MKPFKILMLVSCFIFASTFVHAVPKGPPEKIATEKVFAIKTVDQYQFEIAPVISYQMFDHQYLVQPAIAAYGIQISIFKRSWIIPWSIGTADTKRHIRWLSFVRKLC